MAPTIAPIILDGRLRNTVIFTSNSTNPVITTNTFSKNSNARNITRNDINW